MNYTRCHFNSKLVATLLGKIIMYMTSRDSFKSMCTKLVPILFHHIMEWSIQAKIGACKITEVVKSRAENE